ncbi:MAPK/MAK/MRK overlapping kinase [Exaiptasia diaphana]|uniref:Protein kinase domain-containing protein n=1 Tax=Exaiptasia diaphana TaxID=2652724 RepID=A0A913X7R2_EXADI|nr:MAPK/MAK/MRK overlapping kinase [Exaiptasia diaphana]KXJ14440.1 MAPK/MAK/MRK overlapping kinase [Exaiptasia diaphana]
MQKYRILGKKGEGTFSEVLKVQDVRNGTYFACKKIKQRYDSIEQVNNLREIQAMRRLSPNMNVVELKEIIFDKKNGTLALICELMDMNLYEVIRGRRHYLPESKVKNYMYQLCKSIDHMHRNGIFHRDIKPENILIKDDVLKLADFGSCRSVYSKQPYTEYISTRWYRAPECLLTDGYYNHKMDLWGVGCVFFEVMSLHPLFPGSNEVDQIAKIHDVLGTPPASILQKLRNKSRSMNFNFPQKKGTGISKLLPHASPECIELIELLCTYDPDERISAKQAIRHPYFKDLRELERRAAARASPSEMSVRSNKPLKKKKRHVVNKMKETTLQESILPKEFPSAIIPPPQSNYHPFGMGTKGSVYSNRTVLPKIPLATSMTTSFPTSFPPILNDKTKKTKTTKQYNNYSLPAIDKQGGASGF